jgi:hypothetical protein
MIKKKMGFSPCVYFFQLFAVPQRLRPESLNGPFAARLKSCPDAYLRSEEPLAKSMGALSLVGCGLFPPSSAL